MKVERPNKFEEKNSSNLKPSIPNKYEKDIRKVTPKKEKKPED